MKKFLALLLAVVMVLFAFAACGGNKTPDNADPSADANKTVDYDAISDTCESADGKYELAFVTDVGQLKVSRSTLLTTVRPTSITSPLTATRPQTTIVSML